MIEALASRCGVPILKKNDRFLGSSVDPLKEAAAWAKKAADLLPYGTAAIVIGGGCGYHAAALKRLRSDCVLLILEPDAEVAKYAQKFNPDLTPDDFVITTDWMSLTNEPQVRDALGGEYTIFHHAPTFDLDPDWTKAVTRFLLARDKVSFLLQLRMRPELFALLDANRIAEISNEPISIKTLQRLFAEGASNSRERMLWRTLEELVI